MPRRSLSKGEQWVNRETGEVRWVMVPAEPIRRGGRWYASMMDAMAAISRMRLPARTLWVLLALWGQLDWDNWIHVEQRRLAAELGLDPATVSRAIRQLLESGIIQAGPRAGHIRTYRLSPLVGWRGTAERHSAALEEMQRRGWQVVRKGTADGR